MSGISHIAVWVAGIAHFVLGAGWYTALGQAWLKGIGKTEAEVVAEHGNSPAPYIIALVVAVVIAYALAVLLPKLGAQSAAGGAKAGMLLALTLIATTLAMNYGFEARSFALWLINGGYMTVGLTLMGAIIGGWRKRV